MPFVRIYIDKKTTKETRKKISNSIHNSLVESFTIPLKDKFQVFV